MALSAFLFDLFYETFVAQRFGIRKIDAAADYVDSYL
jgi:hypothetical protein